MARSRGAGRTTNAIVRAASLARFRSGDSERPGGAADGTSRAAEGQLARVGPQPHAIGVTIRGGQQQPRDSARVRRRGHSAGPILAIVVVIS